jgi:hypothetical protein
MPDVHPNIAEHYRTKVIRLAETLAEPESNGEAREDIRSLIGEVVITPGKKRGESHATLHGELMAILDLAAGRRRTPRPEVITNALACPRSHRGATKADDLPDVSRDLFSSGHDTLAVLSHCTISTAKNAAMAVQNSNLYLEAELRGQRAWPRSAEWQRIGLCEMKVT